MNEDYSAVLTCRRNLMRYWEQCLTLYKYNPNCLSPTMLQDYVPEFGSLTALHTRYFNFLQPQYQLKRYENPLLRRMNEYGIAAIKRFSVKELARIQIQNNNIVRLIIKSIVRIDLLDFIRHFPEAAAVLLAYRATEEQQFLPSELCVLFCYCKTRCTGSGTASHRPETCYFKLLYDQLKLLKVEQVIRYDIIMQFAVESAETCVLSYFLQFDDWRYRFLKLSLNTYSCVNTRSFNHLLDLFYQYAELEVFLYQKDYFGLIPMHAAAFLGNVSILKTILVIYANLSTLTADGMSLLDCVLCSRNPLAVKLVIEHLRDAGILAHFLHQLSTKNKFSVFFYPLIFNDDKTLSLLCKTAPGQLLFEKNTLGVSAIQYAAHMSSASFFYTICRHLDAASARDLYKKNHAEWIARRKQRHDAAESTNLPVGQQFKFADPARDALEALRRTIRVCPRVNAAAKLSIYLLLYVLLIGVPFGIFEAEFQRTSHFIFAQTTVSVGFCFKVASLVLLYRKYTIVGRVIDISRVKYNMFGKLRYCARGDQIFNKERVYHCGECERCALLGSIHSSSYVYCIHPSRLGLLLGYFAIDIFVFIQEILLLGLKEGSSNKVRIATQVLLSCATIFGVIWIANEVLNALMRICRNFDLLSAQTPTDGCQENHAAITKPSAYVIVPQLRLHMQGQVPYDHVPDAPNDSMPEIGPLAVPPSSQASDADFYHEYVAVDHL